MEHHERFLRALDASRSGEGRGGAETSIFEPFVTRDIAEKLIWRSGKNLWDTTKHRAATLCSLYEYLKADTVIIDLRGDDEERTLHEVLECGGYLPRGAKFTLISDEPSVLKKAESDDSVGAAASFSAGADCFKKPLIRLSRAESASLREKDIYSAADGGCAGIYLTRIGAAELEAARTKRIAPLGGVGLDTINSDRPVDVHARVEKLAEGGVLLIGSGGFGEETSYLGCISMLGAYNRRRISL